MIETLVKVWENSKKLSKHSPAAVVPTTFLVLPKLHSCYYNSIKARKMFQFLKYNTTYTISVRRHFVKLIEIAHGNCPALHFTSTFTKLVGVKFDLFFFLHFLDDKVDDKMESYYSAHLSLSNVCVLVTHLRTDASY